MSKIEVDTIDTQSTSTALQIGDTNTATIGLGKSGDTITIPSGATITNNGTAAGFGATGAVSWNTTKITADPSPAVSGVGYFCDTSGAAFTVTLPLSPAAGAVVGISDYADNFATANITVGRNGSNIGGAPYDFTLNTDGLSVTFVYVDATQGWIVTDSGLRSDASTTGPYSLDFLVVGGGAAGGGYTGAGYGGGGGGAGGYRNSYSSEASGGGGSSETALSFGIGTVYTITVGGGGAGVSSAINGTNGVDSSISGSGIATITSTGGGGGGYGEMSGTGTTGNSGGSGGGGGSTSGSPGTGGSGGSGTLTQGYAGGKAIDYIGTNASIQAGGGGGASALGESPAATTGGYGGNGLASSITGLSVTRAGGGGGSTYDGTIGPGGTGGAGDGGKSTSATAGTAGTINTGSGGGGGNTAASGAGGSGVVILRMPTVNYSGTYTNAETPIVDGSDTILVFNSTGSYTG